MSNRLLTGKTTQAKIKRLIEALQGKDPTTPTTTIADKVLVLDDDFNAMAEDVIAQTKDTISDLYGKIQSKVLKLNVALDEAGLLNLLATTHSDYECSGFFYNSDINAYCEFEGLYVPFKIGSDTIHFGYCHIKGIHNSLYSVDYYIDDEDGSTWYKRIPDDYITVDNMIVEDYNASIEYSPTGVNRYCIHNYYFWKNKKVCTGVEPVTGEYWEKTTVAKELALGGGGSGVIVDSAMSETSANPVQNKVITSALKGKVDVVTGKGLSTNDYTTAEKTKVAGAITSVTINGTAKTTTDGKIDLGTVITTHQDISGKVDKETGKGLSTNDYTTAEKTKVAGAITSVTINGTAKTTTDGSIDLGTVITSHQDISGKVDKVSGKGLSTNDYTTAEKNKLSGIATGATAVSESTVSGWGFTKNTGTVTSVKINGSSKSPSSGVVDLGSGFLTTGTTTHTISGTTKAGASVSVTVYGK